MFRNVLALAIVCGAEATVVWCFYLKRFLFRRNLMHGHMDRLGPADQILQPDGNDNYIVALGWQCAVFVASLCI